MACEIHADQCVAEKDLEQTIPEACAWHIFKYENVKRAPTQSDEP
jgi:hypothetical protein